MNFAFPIGGYNWSRPFSLAVSLILLLNLNAADRPNIVLIVADDLGYSDLGCYGGEIQTPHLNQLAESGLRLTQFYNTGRCCPSRASILTGQYPHRVGLGHMTKDIGQPGYRGVLSPEATTIGEVLQAAGYRTFLSGKWHLGTKDPTQHGFEEFYGTLASASSFWNDQRYIRLPNERTPRAYGEDEFYGTDALTDYALEFIQLARSTPDQPWFLYLAYNAPHFPLQAPREIIDKYEGTYQVGWDVIRDHRLARMKELGLIDENVRLPPRSHWWNYGETKTGPNPDWESLTTARQEDLSRRMAVYAAMVDRMDTNIGRLVSALKEKDELDNTLIVFLSDNGACAEWDPRGFDERSSNNNVLHQGDRMKQMGGPGTYHSVGSGWANAGNTPWRLYKHYNHEGGISTPCIVHWPDVLERRGAIDHTPGHIIDLLPTFVEVANAEYPKHIDDRNILPLQGQSLMKVFQGVNTEPRTLYFEHEGHRAIREGNFKLTALRDRPWELYDIETDRGEMWDLSKERSELAQRLSEKWARWAYRNHVTPFPEDYGVDYVAPPKPGEVFKRCTVTPIAALPEFRGEWNGSAWGKVKALAVDQPVARTFDHQPKTEVKIQHDDSNLYLMFRVEDYYVKAVTESHQGPVYEDSCIEFFFTPGSDPRLGYFNLEMNCGGTILFAYRRVGEPPVRFELKDLEMMQVYHSEPEIVSPEREGPTTWLLEFSIPFALLEKYCPINPPGPGVEWRGNFHKCGHKTSHPHWLTWSKVDIAESKFHHPEFFGVLKFTSAP